jgi:hypothetical protein
MTAGAIEETTSSTTAVRSDRAGLTSESEELLGIFDRIEQELADASRLHGVDPATGAS